MTGLIQFYRKPGLCPSQIEFLKSKIETAVQQSSLESVVTELCFYIEAESKDLSEQEESVLKWVLSVPFEESCLTKDTGLNKDASSLLIEVGPRLNFSTALSTNSVAICQSFGFTDIKRIEYSIRYLLSFKSGCLPSAEEEEEVLNCLHDPMTQCRYTEPLQTFDLHTNPDPVFEVDVLGKGRKALEKANETLGLAFDPWDLDYYTQLFLEKVQRNPTSVECFDLAQSNSEHSRHWFFKGRLMVDGKEWPESLFSMIMNTQSSSNDNNIIKFNDNSSAIRGYEVKSLLPDSVVGPGKFSVSENQTRHVLFTAETHNFPTGVAPFPGATTGTGGRIRDVQSTGRGAHVIAGTAGYSVGNLHIPGYPLEWEDKEEKYPPNFARPLDVLIEASNGASDYGNKFGEPVITGFARSCGLVTAGGERREYVKPIMFSGGIGMLDGGHVTKDVPEKSMEIVKIGGPVYRIGLGGGAASSVQVQGDNQAARDFSAVQRGDAEMEQKMNRVIRACAELGEKNPIRSIHDQGAGGNGNVLKEIVEPAGGVIHADRFQLGDPTISVMELWGAEYQESNAALVRHSDLPLVTAIGQRERCPVSHVGTVTGTGRIQLENFSRDVKGGDNGRKPVDLELEHVLGSMPRKVFEMKKVKQEFSPLVYPEKLSVRDALTKVLRLPSVASKRYLTNKVDRSVTGLVAQQQCVGPLHTPLADVGVVALSHFDTVGAATAIGEQPVKGLLDPAAGARLSVAEALTNLMFALVSDIRDVKCSGNWMWPAKLEGEGVTLLEACVAMCSFMEEVGVAVDGGKDSLSMAARVGDKVVKAPGTLVISAYVGCRDITKTVTPDLKCPDGKGVLLYLPMGGEDHWRLGGSAFAQCHGQLGDEVPDVEAGRLVKGFNAVQALIADRLLTAGHDVSDGGLVTCLLEMAFAGNCGLELDIPVKAPAMKVLFAEEIGVVLELRESDLTTVTSKLSERQVPFLNLGKSVEGVKGKAANIDISLDGESVLRSPMVELRDLWEETSFRLERRQTNPHCVESEQKSLSTGTTPCYGLEFNPDEIPAVLQPAADAPKVAIIREEGSNGDREMAAAFTLAGFETWDVNMEDLVSKKISLTSFRGVAFVGGFSYADVCGSAKGWAATAKFNSVVSSELQAFKSRPDTFSLGVCNGCQLMALLGWVAPDHTAKEECSQGMFLDHNTSGRFESRFSTMRIQKSPSIMLDGMEGTVWGMWVSHGEGRMVFSKPEIRTEMEQSNLAPVQYVNDAGDPTECYPANPNGSPDGLAALCSPDGRHLAVMPHPERCVWAWQCPWMPPAYREKLKFSPWMRMFQNAYKWCTQSA